MARTSDEIYAALDLGSNSFHLLLARFDGRRLMVVDRYKDMVRMAAGLQEDGCLSEEVMARALEALSKMAERIRPLAKRYVRVVGTNTLRAAKNRDVFLAKAEKILGVPINIISGLEEARLIYLGVAKDFTPEDKTRLVVDIGGGSTELVLGRNKPLKLESLYMGCVSFTRQFFPEGRITRRGYEKALLAARSEVQSLANEYDASNWDQAVGSSGSIRSIERVLDDMGLNRNHVITPEGLESLAQEVIAAKYAEQLALPGLDAERRSVFAGGLAVLHGIFDELQIAEMHVSMYAIREGIIYDLAGRLHQRDKRVETIERMMEQYRVDRAQARRVGRLALTLLEQVERQLETEPEQARNLLQWAVDLHETGLSIAHSGYHKHGAYIVANSDMPGFSRQEQQLLSFLVLNHRRKLKPEPEAYGFVPDWRLVGVLRLACLFLRRRDSALVPSAGIRIAFNGARCRLQLPAKWLDQHPLTREDLLQEKQLLAAVGLELTVRSGS
ncbi:MAG TPA: Ppx/GppA phosphatase family protein [Spongiibacteraceae bacterium]|nr:Ppx/GppA phosphatase family protein [Spongiibacteraceae bacterium]